MEKKIPTREYKEAKNMTPRKIFLDAYFEANKGQILARFNIIKKRKNGEMEKVQL